MSVTLSEPQFPSPTTGAHGGYEAGNDDDDDPRGDDGSSRMPRASDFIPEAPIPVIRK